MVDEDLTTTTDDLPTPLRHPQDHISVTLTAMDRQRKQNSGVKKRSPNACKRCRQQKIKCTGTFPCQPCSRRKLACTFDDSTKKVLVTQGYIRDLQRKVGHLQPEAAVLNGYPTSAAGSEDRERSALQDDVNEWLGSVDETAQPDLTAPPAVHEANMARRASSSPSAQLMNPLAIDAGNYIADGCGRPFHLGTSSNWSFGRRVLSLACDRLGIQLPAAGLHFEGSVYDLDWQTIKVNPKQQAQSLPSSDYAVYLINAVKFHCGQMFHLFDEDNFMQQFSVFHENENGREKVSQLWYIHYLLVIALGKAFVGRNTHGRSPPGAELFLEAMRMLPEITFFFTDLIEPIEILICAALYLQCLDFRSLAYNIIGQALRKSLEQGMHTQMSFQDLSDSVVQRCRQVWWTVYMLDRQMSSLMGLPLGIRDEDISAPLPAFSKSSQKKIGLELHVKLSRVIADIMNTVYSTEGRLARKFLTSTKQALKSIATVTDLLKRHVELPSSHSSGGISRLAAHLHLLHYQCICLTTRPLAYSFLERRLRSITANTKYARPTGSVRVLLKTCVESAQQMLHILISLRSQGLLESFLPFDLESAFISAIILIMANAVDPSLLEDHGQWSETAYSILDDMASHGNMIAVFRKRELQQLVNVLNILPPIMGDMSGNSSGQFDGDTLLASTNETSEYADPGVAAPHHGALGDMNDKAIDDAFLQDDLTAEQLMLIADSLDLDGLDWMTTSLGDSSAHSQIL